MSLIRTHRKEWNHLGLEIRDALVQDCLERIPSPHKNLHYMTCNFAASLEDLLQSLPVNSVRLLSFQFPDPWRKSKHLRRRIVQSDMLQKLSKYLSIGACVYVSSDCEEIAMDMKKTLDECASFTSLDINEFTNLTNKKDCFSHITPDAFIVRQYQNRKEAALPATDSISYNPLDEPSERELVCEVEWRRVWRFIFVRNDVALRDYSISIEV